MEDWPEFVDQIEAWPEEPELVEDTDILGRWLYGAAGVMNMAISSTTQGQRVLVYSFTLVRASLEGAHTRDVFRQSFGFDFSRRRRGCGAVRRR